MAYDVAQICKNGHIINYRATEYPESNQSFCAFCGAETIKECPNCNTPIRGAIMDDRYGDLRYALESFPLPNFCLSCGKPFPWTFTAIEAAKKLAHELELLDEQEQAILANSIDDLVKESPKIQAAAARVKRLVLKAGVEAVSMFKDILTGVLSEAVKKILFPIP